MENSKKHPTLGVWCAPPKYFSEFYKLFLGFYKSQLSGTTYVLVDKCLLLVYGLFKNLKNLTFVMVRCHKTLNGAIYIYIYLSIPMKYNMGDLIKGSHGNLLLSGFILCQIQDFHSLYEFVGFDFCKFNFLLCHYELIFSIFSSIFDNFSANFSIISTKFIVKF